MVVHQSGSNLGKKRQLCRRVFFCEFACAFVLLFAPQRATNTRFRRVFGAFFFGKFPRTFRSSLHGRARDRALSLASISASPRVPPFLICRHLLVDQSRDCLRVPVGLPSVAFCVVVTREAAGARAGSRGPRQSHPRRSSAGRRFTTGKIEVSRPRHERVTRRGADAVADRIGWSVGVKVARPVPYQSRNIEYFVSPRRAGWRRASARARAKIPRRSLRQRFGARGRFRGPRGAEARSPPPKCLLRRRSCGRQQRRRRIAR